MIVLNWTLLTDGLCISLTPGIDIEIARDGTLRELKARKAFLKYQRKGIIHYKRALTNIYYWMYYNDHPAIRML